MRLIILSIIALQSFGCMEPDLKLSIPEETLVNIITDLHVVEEVVQRHTGTVKDSLVKSFKSQIFEIHNVDSLAVERDLLALKKSPSDYKIFYDKVIQKLESMEHISEDYD